MQIITKSRIISYCFFCIFCIFIYPKNLFPSDYCIVLISGKKIIADDHWIEGDKLYYQVNDNEYSINRNRISNIIDTENHDFSQNTSNANPKNTYKLSTYESDGGILFLNNGKSFEFDKSWIDNNQIAVLYDHNIVLINPDNIKVIQKRKSYIENSHINFDNIKAENPSTIREKAFYKNRTTKALLRQIAWNKKLCDEIKSQLKYEYDSFTPNKKSEKCSNLIIKSTACQAKLSEVNYQMSQWAKQFYREYDKIHKNDK
jgi:hypothetical protein